MSMPGYTAEFSLRANGFRERRRAAGVRRKSVIPALPSAQTCEWAADQCDANPKSPACRVLQHCTGAIARNPAGGVGAGGGVFSADYVNCVLECSGNASCIDRYC